MFEYIDKNNDNKIKTKYENIKNNMIFITETANMYN